MGKVPPISRFMFSAPLIIEREATVEEARQKMEQYGIRHLPIVHDDKVVGLVSSRDVEVACALQEKLGELQVGMIKSEHVFTVNSSRPLDEVLREMASYKYGSAIVVDAKGKAIGIFTSVDAIKLLATILNEEVSGIDLTECAWPE